MKWSAALVIGVSLVLVGLMGMAGVMAFDFVFSDGRSVYPSDMPPLGNQGGASSRVDAMFIQRMIPHHDGAIAMSDMALTRAEHPELRQLAQRIRRTQIAENAQMRAWYRDWFGSDVASGSAEFEGMDRGMMGRGSADIDALENAESFDREFLEQMIPHHQMAVMMARMAGRSTQRTQMRDFTQSIVEGQSRELALMEEWYREWYGR